MGSEVAKPQFPAAAIATPNGPGVGSPSGLAGTRVVIAVAEAGSSGPVWAAVVHPGSLRLTEPTAVAGDPDPSGEWGPKRAGPLFPQPAAAQSRTTIAVARAAPPLSVTNLYVRDVSFT
jgi:hypothetical protein